jgi:ATP-dependent helicase/nuclease subunit B
MTNSEIKFQKSPKSDKMRHHSVKLSTPCHRPRCGQGGLMKGCATMLTLILGRAGTGKTERMMDEICRRIAKRGRVFYIVPEQYSHEAERQLLRRCGDGLSLYGEVLSFTRLTHRVLAQTGGLAQRAISGGGRILLMSCAVSDVAGRLKVYGGAARRPEYLQLLVETVSLLKRACISPLDLEAASRRARDPLRDKLHDLSLIAAAYDARFTEDMIDPEDLPAKLAEAVASCSLFNEADIFIDGFYTCGAARRDRAFAAGAFYDGVPDLRRAGGDGRTL